MNSVQNQGSLLQNGLVRLGLATLGTIPLATAGLAAEVTFFEESQLNEQLTVSAILAEPSAGMSVTLQGFILQRGDDDEEFIFTDGTDEITVEIYDDSFIIDPNTMVEIVGEVDLEAEDLTQHEAHPESVEIDVYEVQIVTP